MNKSFLILFFALMQHFIYGQKNFLDQPYLETSAYADTLVTPNRIYLSININEADSKNKKSVEIQEKEMENALKKLGINTEKDLVLLDLASNFKNYFLKGQNVLKSKGYELLVKDAVSTGKVLIALENIGIANSYISRTEHSNAEQIYMDLKRQAVAKTKIIAQKMVQPLGQKVGKAVHISDVNDYGGYAQYRMKESRMHGASADEDPINIEVKKIKFEAQVSVKYLLVE